MDAPQAARRPSNPENEGLVDISAQAPTLRRNVPRASRAVRSQLLDEESSETENDTEIEEEPETEDENIVESGRYKSGEGSEFLNLVRKVRQPTQVWEVGEELSKMIFDLIALSSTNVSGPEVTELRLWTTDMVVKSLRHTELGNEDVDKSLVEAEQRTSERIAKARLITEEQAVASKLKAATETLWLYLDELCESGTAARQTAFQDIVKEQNGQKRKRKRVDQDELEASFEAVEELRKKWKTTREISSHDD